jgi:hypothetical protein
MHFKLCLFSATCTIPVPKGLAGAAGQIPAARQAAPLNIIDALRAA